MLRRTIFVREAGAPAGAGPVSDGAEPDGRPRAPAPCAGPVRPD